MENQINANDNTNSDIFQLFDLWAKYKYLWPWFVISVVICCSIAMVYIKFTPKTYMRWASVLIRDDSSAPDIAAAFSNRVVVNWNSNVKNEVEAFRSPQLVQDVVRRLDLTVEYFHKNKMKTVDMYGKSPIKASFPGSTEYDYFYFQVEFTPDHSVTLTKFESGSQKYDNHTIRGKFNDTLQTPIGKVVISPTSYYGEGWCFIPLDVYKHNILSATRTYAGKLKSSLSSKDNAIVRLEFTDNVIPRADNFLNALMDAYNDNWIFEKNKVAANTLKVIKDRLQVEEQEFRTISANLERFKSQNLLTNVQLAASLYMSQSSDYSSRILEVTNQISMANFIMENLKKDNVANTILPANSGLGNSAIEQQIKAYNDIVLEREQLIPNNSDNNPRIADMNSKLATMRSSIDQSVLNHIEALSRQLSGYQEREAQITRNIASNPGLEGQLFTLEREYKIKETLYLHLLQKKEENEMALITSSTNTRIISLPTGRKTPVSPKSNLVMLTALFIGVMIPGSVVFGKELLDVTIRGEHDLEGLSVPFLGVVSMADSKVQKGGALLVKDKGTDMLNETFRMVRTNLDALCGSDMKVIMFTSLEPGPGKTFIALNLAMSMALAGKRIALLDTDMRTSTLSRMISNPAQGLSFFLNGLIPEERFIIEENYFYNGFDVIPVGEIPPNPTELLMTDRFKGLIARLKRNYDYVFLDCTPLEVVTDANIVGKHADLAVFIVRESYTNRRKLRVLEKINQKGQFRKMAMILNASKLEVTYSKHHTFFNEKVNEIAKLPRAAYSPGNTKYLPGGTKMIKY